MEYLDFEKELEELDLQIKNKIEFCEKNNSDMTKVLKELKNNYNQKKKIYQNLSPWQKVQISRHPHRPYTLDYIEYLAGDTFIELHGDRNIKDDKAMIGGFGKINNQTVMFIGQQKVVIPK